jgi:hypothetical protein
MQCAQNWHRWDTADGLDAAGNRRILMRLSMARGLVQLLRGCPNQVRRDDSYQAKTL